MSRARTFFKWSLISIALVALTWLAVVIWWQTTQRVVTLRDTLVYLLAFPLTVLMTVGLLKWWTFRRKHRKTSSSADTSTIDGASTVASEPAPKLPVLATWALTSFAPNAEAFVEVLKERQIRPLPDALLTDDQGFPILASRITHLDIETIRQQVEDTVAERKIDNVPDPENWREAFLRTLGLLQNLLDQVLDELPLTLDLPARSQPTREEGAFTLRGNAPLTSAADDERLRLKIKLLVPAHFRPLEQRLTLAYLLERTADIPVHKEHIQVDVVPATDDATALALMDQFNADAGRGRHAHALLVLACDSALCDTIAQDWQAEGRLFSPRRPNGLMMGEGAFGVLCANEKAVQSVATAPACRLTRVSRAQRDTSADTQGKPSYTSLAEVIKNALLAANLPAESIGSVACDADHRTNRTLECMGAMMDQIPHLDAVQNRLAAGEACGHIGAASVAAALVAAVMQSKASQHPVLLFNVSHATDRAAAILIPPDTAAA
jgi:hypothetical protein